MKSNSRLVVQFIGAVAVLGLAGIIGLAIFGKQIPEGLIQIVTGAGASLGTILANVSHGTQAVQVVNAETDPVPTTDAGGEMASGVVK